MHPPPRERSTNRVFYHYLHSAITFSATEAMTGNRGHFRAEPAGKVFEITDIAADLHSWCTRAATMDGWNTPSPDLFSESDGPCVTPWNDRSPLFERGSDSKWYFFDGTAAAGDVFAKADGRGMRPRVHAGFDARGAIGGGPMSAARLITMYQASPEEVALYNGLGRLGVDADHFCHNAQCLNPAHLYLRAMSGNRADNGRSTDERRTSVGFYPSAAPDGSSGGCRRQSLRGAAANSSLTTSSGGTSPVEASSPPVVVAAAAAAATMPPPAPRAALSSAAVTDRKRTHSVMAAVASATPSEFGGCSQSSVGEFGSQTGSQHLPEADFCDGDPLLRCLRYPTEGGGSPAARAVGGVRAAEEEKEEEEEEEEQTQPV